MAEILTAAFPMWTPKCGKSKAKYYNYALAFLDIKIWLHLRCTSLLSKSQVSKRKPQPCSQKRSTVIKETSANSISTFYNHLFYKDFSFKLNPYTGVRRGRSINNTQCLGKDICSGGDQKRLKPKTIYNLLKRVNIK